MINQRLKLKLKQKPKNILKEEDIDNIQKSVGDLHDSLDINQVLEKSYTKKQALVNAKELLSTNPDSLFSAFYAKTHSDRLSIAAKKSDDMLDLVEKKTEVLHQLSGVKWEPELQNLSYKISTVNDQTMINQSVIKAEKYSSSQTWFTNYFYPNKAISLKDNTWNLVLKQRGETLDCIARTPECVQTPSSSYFSQELDRMYHFLKYLQINGVNIVEKVVNHVINTSSEEALVASNSTFALDVFVVLTPILLCFSAFPFMFYKFGFIKEKLLLVLSRLLPDHYYLSQIVNKLVPSRFFEEITRFIYVLHNKLENILVTLPTRLDQPAIILLGGVCAGGFTLFFFRSYALNYLANLQISQYIKLIKGVVPSNLEGVVILIGEFAQKLQNQLRDVLSLDQLNNLKDGQNPPSSSFSQIVKTKT